MEMASCFIHFFCACILLCTILLPLLPAAPAGRSPGPIRLLDPARSLLGAYLVVESSTLRQLFTPVSDHQILEDTTSLRSIPCEPTPEIKDSIHRGSMSSSAFRRVHVGGQSFRVLQGKADTKSGCACASEWRKRGACICRSIRSVNRHRRRIC